MGALSLVGVVALLGGGFVAYFGAWRCRFDIDRAGVFAHPVAGIAALVWLLGFGALLFVSPGGGPYVAFAKVGIALSIGFLYAPLLAYHAGQALGSVFSAETALPPDPEDPFVRAKAAEDRGDTLAAVERYSWLLEREPAHFEARTRLAELLARSGRPERAKAVLDAGVSLPGAEGWMRFKWRELRVRIEEGAFGEAKPEGERPTFKALGDVRAARLDAWKEGSSSRDDGPIDASSLDGRRT